jgi:hypothetical protein
MRFIASQIGFSGERWQGPRGEDERDQDAREVSIRRVDSSPPDGRADD